ncbi:cytochrome c-type biogenesis protein [Candidatus Pelagibacter sp. IMCC9063]|uniref:cytochrome c-type biogenesis protein n=1 Tax=Pelagibacter sp. (strain IMCC9063) TaxID=1002672 RepID=UPI0005A4A6F9|nr:cytochrome c-type biogenesis protein [Candidatus Pelagibacter sp. IMCC9063]
MRNIFLIILFVFFIPAQIAMASDEREINIYKNIRCLVCQGQSLNDSNSDFAVDLKKVIKKKITNKQSDKEIYKYLIERYGDWILFNPPLKINTLLLWALPFLFLFVGGLLIYQKYVFLDKKHQNQKL